MKFKVWRMITGRLEYSNDNEKETAEQFDKVFNELCQVVPKAHRRILTNLVRAIIDVAAMRTNEGYLAGLKSGIETMYHYMEHCKDVMGHCKDVMELCQDVMEDKRQVAETYYQGGFSKVEKA